MNENKKIGFEIRFCFVEIFLCAKIMMRGEYGKTTIVINGVGGCGKDTLIKMLEGYYKILNVSSITPVNEILFMCGWDGIKTDEVRKSQAELKEAITKFNDYPTKYLLAEQEKFMLSNKQLMFVHIREPHEIAKFVNLSKTRTFTLLILPRDELKNKIYGNKADDSVNNYNYDLVFNNNAPLDETKNIWLKFFIENVDKENNKSNTIKMIEKYEPANEQEKADKQLFIDSEKQEQILTRDNKLCHLVASAFIVNKERTKVLCVYHNIYNSWSWVGGHADGEDDMLTVAKREVKEETHLQNFSILKNTPISIESICVKAHIKKGEYVNAHTHLNVTYLFEADESEQIQKQADENSAVAWLTFDELLKKSTEPHMVVIYEKIINKIKNEII